MQTYTIEVAAIEWIYVLKRLLKGYTMGTDFTIGSSVEGHAIYMVPAHLIPTADLAKATGATEDQIRKAARIVLNPIPGSKAWQKPTVPYWGEC